MTSIRTQPRLIYRVLLRWDEREKNVNIKYFSRSIILSPVVSSLFWIADPITPMTNPQWPSDGIHQYFHPTSQQSSPSEPRPRVKMSQIFLAATARLRAGECKINWCWSPRHGPCVPPGEVRADIIKWSLIGPHYDVTCCSVRGSGSEMASYWPILVSAGVWLAKGAWAVCLIPSLARGITDNLSLCLHFILYMDALVMVNMCHQGGNTTQG